MPKKTSLRTPEKKAAALQSRKRGILPGPISGTEVDRGREIPFLREFPREGVTSTYYGRGKHAGKNFGRDNSCLIHSESEGGVKWRIMVDREKVKHGSESGRILKMTGVGKATHQEITRITESAVTEEEKAIAKEKIEALKDEDRRQRTINMNALWNAVDGVLYHKDPCDLDAAAIFNVIFNFINSGDREGFDELGSIIEAVRAQRENETQKWLVAKSVGNAAREHDRIPTVAEILKAYWEESGHAGQFQKGGHKVHSFDAFRHRVETNVRKDLKAIGFGWIAQSKKTGNALAKATP